MSLDKVPQAGELYIGGYEDLISMRRSEALKRANITHVVSALSQFLEPEKFQGYQHLVVPVDDVDDEDIVQYFPKSNAFISQGLASGGGVLVHCMMGKSRSATLVIAFLLHQDPTRTSETALESLRSVRSIAEPNDGFMQQLRLYHSMGAPESVEGHPEYQRWLYNRYVQQSIECGQAPENIRFEDEEEPVERTTEGLAFRCRKCSKTLASSRYLIPHDPEPASATQDALRAAATGAISELPASREGGSAVTAPVQCAHFFIDPLIWMQSELYEGKLNGRLECPGCNSSVGKYAWQGMKCSCGKWITPAFSLLRSRIDEMRPRPVISPGGEQARAGAGNRGGFGGKI